MVRPPSNLIQTEIPGVILRPIEFFDALHIEEAVSDKRFPPQLPLSEKVRTGQHNAWVESMVLSRTFGGPSFWSIDIGTSERCIGQVGLLMDEVTTKLWLAYWLHPKYWGQGLQKAAVAALVNYAFRELQAREIFAAVGLWNERSSGLLTRLGFNKSGCQGPGYELDGEHHNTEEFVTTRKRWIDNNA
jgi:RimJ/RimL family protein N-acetyltransferase